MNDFPFKFNRAKKMMTLHVRWSDVKMESEWIAVQWLTLRIWTDCRRRFRVGREWLEWCPYMVPIQWSLALTNVWLPGSTRHAVSPLLLVDATVSRLAPDLNSKHNHLFISFIYLYKNFHYFPHFLGLCRIFFIQFTYTLLTIGCQRTQAKHYLWRLQFFENPHCLYHFCIFSNSNLQKKVKLPLSVSVI